MTSEAKKQVLRVLTAVLALVLFRVFFAPSSSGALYDNGPPAPSLWNSTRDPDREGRGPMQAFSTSAGTVYFFRIHLVGSYDNKQVPGLDLDNRTYAPIFTEDFPSDAPYELKGELGPSPDIRGIQGRLWEATIDMRGNRQDIVEPIPSVAWFLALGVIGLVALKRRRKRG